MGKIDVYNDNTLAVDMVLLCADTVGGDVAQKAIRALFRHFGGQMVYIPLIKETGTSAGNIRGILADAVGDSPAQKILEKIMLRFGGLQIYIPLERCAFRKTIALEIYERNYSKNEAIKDLAREYNISFNLAYTLWKEGRSEKFEKTLPYLPFLEF
jgi:Mor family transcriptional regulator